MEHDAGRARAAEAAELRRLELDLAQTQLGVDPKTWRDFIAGRSWPQVRSRARIESRLNWHIGALDRIAAGRSTPEQESIDRRRGGESPSAVQELLSLVHEVNEHFRTGQYGLAVRKLDLLIGIAQELAATALRAATTDVEHELALGEGVNGERDTA